MTKCLYRKKVDLIPSIPEYPEYPIFTLILKVRLAWGGNYIGILKNRSILGY